MVIDHCYSCDSSNDYCDLKPDLQGLAFVCDPSQLWYHCKSIPALLTGQKTQTNMKTARRDCSLRFDRCTESMPSTSINSRGQGHWQRQATECHSIASQLSPFLLTFITTSHQNCAPLSQTASQTLCDPHTHPHNLHIHPHIHTSESPLLDAA